MNQQPRPHARRATPAAIGWRITAVLFALGSLAGCGATNTRLLRDGESIVVAGRVSRIDRSPMAWDGDGLLMLATRAHGEVTVHLAARRNLCLAQGLDLFDAATVGMRIEAAGTATGPADLSVCRESSHYLKAMP